MGELPSSPIAARLSLDRRRFLEGTNTAANVAPLQRKEDDYVELRSLDQSGSTISLDFQDYAQ